MSDITVINDTQQSELVTNGLAVTGELYLKAAGSTDAGAIVVYDSGSWRTFANEAGPSFSNTYSVSFDGSNDSIDLGDKFDFIQNTCQFTISGWFKFSNYTSTAGNQGLLSSNYTGSKKGFFLIYDNRSNSKKIRAGLYAGSTVFAETNNGIGDNNWHHIAATCAGAGNDYKLFIDGSVVNTTTAPATTSTSADATMKVGNASSTASAYFNGLADEVAVFSSALTASNISDIYNSGEPTDISSLSPVGWWRMGDDDSGTGTTVTDQGSGGNNATLVNGPTFSTNVPS